MGTHGTKYLCIVCIYIQHGANAYSSQTGENDCASMTPSANKVKNGFLKPEIKDCLPFCHSLDTEQHRRLLEL